MDNGDKYHRKGKMYTVIQTPDWSMPTVDQSVQIEDTCGTKSMVPLMYFLMNYSKYINTQIIT